MIWLIGSYFLKALASSPAAAGSWILAPDSS